MTSLFGYDISYIEIVRKMDFLGVNIITCKPSSILGKEGKNLLELQSKLNKLLELGFFKRNLVLKIIEVINPDIDANVLANSVREQLEKRVPFRRVIRNTVSRARKAGVKGIKVQISGRLNGNEIARTEWVREGQVPLHTLKANIDYSDCKALELRMLL